MLAAFALIPVTIGVYKFKLCEDLDFLSYFDIFEYIDDSSYLLTVIMVLYSIKEFLADRPRPNEHLN